MGLARNEPNSPTSSPPVTTHNQLQQHSPWHSPVPYLFGGLAAMLGLIAFALLILACSYWKLSGYLEGGSGGDGGGDLENPDHEKPSDGSSDVKIPPVFDKVVVIMAGDEKPTFLATPMSSRASSFGDNNNNNKSNKNLDSMNEEKEESEDKLSSSSSSSGGGCSDQLVIVPDDIHNQTQEER